MNEDPYYTVLINFPYLFLYDSAFFLYNFLLFYLYSLGNASVVQKH